MKKEHKDALLSKLNDQMDLYGAFRQAKKNLVCNIKDTYPDTPDRAELIKQAKSLTLTDWCTWWGNFLESWGIYY